MRPSTPQSGKSSGRHRPSVRIVKPRTRATQLTLFGVGVAVLALLFLWRVVQPSEAPGPRVRTVRDVTLTYRCESGHVWEAFGQVGPRTCQTCASPAFAVGTYRCREHGVFSVDARFIERPDGTIRPSRFRLSGGDWTPAKEGVYCPRCDRRLERVRGGVGEEILPQEVGKRRPGPRTGG